MQMQKFRGGFPVTHRGAKEQLRRVFVKRQSSLSSTSPAYYASRNGKMLSTTMPPSAVQAQAPNAPYTVMRTVNRRNIFRYSEHIKRLCASCQGVGIGVDVDTMRAMVTTQLRQAIMNFYHHSPQVFEKELRILVVVAPDQNNKGADLFLHLEPLTVPSTPTVKAEVVSLSRDNPHLKNTAWPVVVKKVLANKPGVEDLLIIDHEQRILEGGSSNFFAVSRGRLLTAKHGVLDGTVRQLVMQTCRKEGIEVLEAPKLQDLPTMDGAFITSTSRLILPLHTIIIDPQVTTTAPREIKYDQIDPFLKKLQQLVVASFEADAELF